MVCVAFIIHLQRKNFGNCNSFHNAYAISNEMKLICTIKVNGNIFQYTKNIYIPLLSMGSDCFKDIINVT